MPTNNTNLQAAKAAKNDEFYTSLTDIEKELDNYKGFFKGKIVYCNCDDPRESNFSKFFSVNFETLGLKKLITTGYKADGHGVCSVYDGDKNGNVMADNQVVTTELKGNGDFQSEECVEFLKQADVVVTNPPFSLFRAYVKQLMDYGKKFLVIGNMNAISYKEIFPYIKNNQLWLGCRGLGKDFFFNLTDEYKKEIVKTKTRGGGWKIIDGEIMGRVASACWFTNIPHTKRNTPIDLYRRYNPTDNPKYDNYDAIEVGKVADIPMDYDGVMGVPITFLDKYCPTQFEIVGLMSGAKDESLINGNDGRAKFYIDGKGVYSRICIKRVSQS